MEMHQIVLVVTLFSAGLAAGVFFTFTTLVVPGLLDMDPRASLQGFQAIDGRLQPDAPSVDWQPVFGAVIAGPALLTLATLVLSWPNGSTTTRTLTVAAATVYNLGVWGPTFTTILPFNNRLRDIDLDATSRAETTRLRADFARIWRGWNLVRTVSSTASFALLIVVARASGP